MPNWVTNILTINGTTEKINEVKEFIKSDSEGIGSIDFNKITPMPKWIYAGDLSSKEIEKYGEENCWYDWCINNWGTKWNADSYISTDKNSDIVKFLTAWSCPILLIKRLSWIFPDIELEIAWADEDMGCNLGIFTFKDGEIIYRYLPEECSREAYKLFVKIMGGEPEDYWLNENYEYVGYE